MAKFRKDTSPNNTNQYIQDFDNEPIYDGNDYGLEDFDLGNINSDELSNMLQSLMDNPEFMDQVKMMQNIGGSLDFINKLQGPLKVLSQLNDSLGLIGGFNGIGNIAGLLNGLGNNGYRGNNRPYGPRNNYAQRNNYGPRQNYGAYNNHYQQPRYNQPNNNFNRYRQSNYPAGGPNLLGGLLGGAGNILMRLFMNR